MRFISKLLLPIVLMMHPLCYALEADRKEPIHFTAGAIEWDQLSHTGTFKDNVSFTQGSTQLFASRGCTKGDDNNQFEEVMLYGDTKQQAHFITIPKPNEKQVDAYADKMVYLPQKKVIQLFGKVYITQGRYHFSAPYLEYNIEKKKIISHSDNQQKTTVVVDPEKS